MSEKFTFKNFKPNYENHGYHFENFKTYYENNILKYSHLAEKPENLNDFHSQIKNLDNIIHELSNFKSFIQSEINRLQDLFEQVKIYEKKVDNDTKNYKLKIQEIKKVTNQMPETKNNDLIQSNKLLKNELNEYKQFVDKIENLLKEKDTGDLLVRIQELIKKRPLVN
jgi:hypothetical protein